MANDNVSSHAPIDPALVLPPAVAAARDRANALMAQLNGTTAIVPPNGGPPAPMPLTPGGEFIAMEPAAPQPTNPTPAPFALGPPEPIVAQPPQPQQPQQPQPEPPPDYEHLYKSLRGRFESEVPRLREGISAQLTRNQELERLLAGLGAGQPNGMPNGQPNGQPGGIEFTEAEREQWGEDLLNTIASVVDRRARDLVGQQMQPLVDQTRRATQQTMEGYLDEHVPTWRQVNFDPGFMNWSLLPDPFSGFIRKDLMQRAFNEGDAPRVARFFQAYSSSVAPGPVPQPGPGYVQPTPPAPAPQLPAGPPQLPSNRIPLQELAAPSGAGGTAGPPAPPVAPRIYKRSDITRFYADKALGKFNTPDLQAQAAAIEQDLFAAGREGRVVNG